jgi:hypothetical protein
MSGYILRKEKKEVYHLAIDGKKLCSYGALYNLLITTDPNKANCSHCLRLHKDGYKRT